MHDIKDRFAAAQAIGRSAGAMALDYFRGRDSLKVESKGLQDVVSIADRAVEDHIRAAIEAQFPGDAILGEEGGGDVDPAGDAPIWVIDPIDGTQCFLSGIPTWCVSIALVAGGQPRFGVIYDPNANEAFAGGPGLGVRCNDRAIAPSQAASFADGMTEIGYSHRVPRDLTVRVIDRLIAAGGIYHRSGSGALSLAYVAAGRYIGYFEDHMNAWDSLAGVAMIQAGGGWTNDVLAENGLLDGAVVVASGPNLAAEMRALCEFPEADADG